MHHLIVLTCSNMLSELTALACIHMRLVWSSCVPDQVSVAVLHAEPVRFLFHTCGYCRLP